MTEHSALLSLGSLALRNLSMGGPNYEKMYHQGLPAGNKGNVIKDNTMCKEEGV